MGELVVIKKDQVLTTSLKVAEDFEKNHRDVLRSIRDLIEQMDDCAILRTPLFQETTYTNQQNKKQPMYLMNRDGFSLLVMGFTGKKALEWKLKYIQAFNQMERLLLERQTAEWIEGREWSKVGCRKLTEVIKAKVIPNARAHGSQCKEQFFYSNPHSWINKRLGISSKQRDNLSLQQINDLNIMQAIAAKVYDTDEEICITELNNKLKQSLDNYVEVAFVAQRYLLN